MKNILSNAITSIATSAIASGYGNADVLLNDKQTDLIMSNALSTFTITATCNDQYHNSLQIGNTNADQVALTVRDSTSAIVHTDTVSLSSISGVYDYFPGRQRSKQRNKTIDYPTQYNEPGGTVEAVLTASGSVNVYVATFRCGKVFDTGHGPNDGLEIEPVDRSKYTTMLDGSVKQRKGSITHKFYGVVNVNDNYRTARHIRALYEEYGKAPLPWRVCDLAGFEWDIFAALSWSYAFGRIGALRFELEEVAYKDMPGETFAAAPSLEMLGDLEMLGNLEMT